METDKQFKKLAERRAKGARIRKERRTKDWKREWE
jgi:hypothetical protein